MLLWAALALIGFLALVAVVVVLGTGSTDRYEREKQARADFARAAAQVVRVPQTTT